MAIITLCIWVKYIQVAIVDNVLTHYRTGPILQLVCFRVQDSIVELITEWI